MEKTSNLMPLRGDALIIVDVQNDFLPGGSLAVPGSDEVIPVLNRYIRRFRKARLPVFATRDWHPANHCSFSDQGGPWPPHCIGNSLGAAFPDALELPADTITVSAATRPDKEAYSGFEGTDLDDRLHARGVTRLFIGGIATDYCVLNTVQDALTAGYEVLLLDDAIRAVNVEPDDGLKARRHMLRLGAQPIQFDRVA